MFDQLVPIVLFVSLAVASIGITRIVSDGRTRRKLIEAGATPEQVQAISARPDPGLADALKWGLVIGAIGLALIVIQFIPYRPDEPISFGLVLVFGAGGLLAYYSTARRLADR